MSAESPIAQTLSSCGTCKNSFVMILPFLKGRPWKFLRQVQGWLGWDRVTKKFTDIGVSLLRKFMDKGFKMVTHINSINDSISYLNSHPNRDKLDFINNYTMSIEKFAKELQNNRLF